MGKRNFKKKGKGKLVGEEVVSNSNTVNKEKKDWKKRKKEKKLNLVLGKSSILFFKILRLHNILWCVLKISIFQLLQGTWKHTASGHYFVHCGMCRPPRLGLGPEKMFNNFCGINDVIFLPPSIYRPLLLFVFFSTDPRTPPRTTILPTSLITCPIILLLHVSSSSLSEIS